MLFADAFQKKKLKMIMMTHKIKKTIIIKLQHDIVIITIIKIRYLI